MKFFISISFFLSLLLQTVNVKYSSSILAGEEVQVVPTKVLKVDLPSRRIISIIAHKGSTLREVLRPLLNKYGFKLEVVTVWADGHPVDMDIAAVNAPARLTLTSGNEGTIHFILNKMKKNCYFVSIFNTIHIKNRIPPRLTTVEVSR